MSDEFIVRSRPFNNVECCFDIVAAFGNDVKSNQIKFICKHKI